MSDLLRPLLNAIETVQKRIETARSAGWNEAQTRASLIDPILTALGWDTSDPALVSHEITAQGGRADYALVKSEKELAAIIEAKALGNLLDTAEVNQTTTYANILGAPYAVLTDGNHWLLYDIFRRGIIDDRRLLDMSLSGEPAPSIALKLLVLWRPNACSGQPHDAKAPLVADLNSHAGKEQSSTGREEEPTGSSATWVPLTSVPREKGQIPPSLIRFPDAEERSISKWNQVLIFTTEWLVSRRSLTEAMMPIQATPKRFLLNTEPLDSRGVDFHSPKQISGTSIYLETHWNLTDTLKRTVEILRRCSRDPSQISVRFAPKP